MKKVMEQLFETEKQKWLKKSYADLKKIGDEYDPYTYVLEVNEEEYPVNVRMLESRDEYIQPCLTVYDCEERFRIFGIIVFRHNCSIDWVVDRDDTVHV